MDDIDRVTIVPLQAEDAPAGLALSDEAHWNQTEDDWRFFLNHASVFGMRDCAATLIATAALLPYEGGNAWISMVLVTADWRRRGLATRLLDACLDAADKDKLTSWLDATPAGTAVYGPLGFTPSVQLQRLTHAGMAAQTPQPPARPLSAAGLDDLVARDRRAMGFARGDLLADLSARPGSRLVAHDDAICLVRDGRTARHIGPLLAEHTGSATALVEAVVRSEPGPFLIDAVGSRTKFVDALTAAGWVFERSFQRMRFGRLRSRGAELPFACAGPEYG